MKKINYLFPNKKLKIGFSFLIISIFLLFIMFFFESISILIVIITTAIFGSIFYFLGNLQLYFQQLVKIDG
jgi:1,4-dihydroxy-2-naphthoate octaprenyltransferase